MENNDNNRPLSHDNEIDSFQPMSIRSLLIQPQGISDSNNEVSTNIDSRIINSPINNSISILNSNEFNWGNTTTNSLFTQMQLDSNNERASNNNINRNSLLLSHSPSPILPAQLPVEQSMAEDAMTTNIPDRSITNTPIHQATLGRGINNEGIIQTNVADNTLFSNMSNTISSLEINRSNSLSPIHFHNGHSILGGFLTQRLPSISPVNNLEANMDPSPLESPINKDLSPDNKNNLSPNFRKLKSNCVEIITRRYFRQVMYGCSKDSCTNNFCAGNPNFTPRDINEATALSVTLSQYGSEHICSDVPEFDPSDNSNFPLPLQKSLRADFGRDFRKRNRNKNWVALEEGLNEQSPTLTFDLIKKLNEEAQSSSEYDSFAQILYNVFSKINLLSISFPQNNETLKTFCPLNIEDTRNAYYFLIHECPKIVIASVMKGISTLFEKLKLGLEVIREKHLTAIYIVLLNPMLMDTSSHLDIVPRFCDMFTTLSDKYIRIFCDYIRARRFVEEDIESEELQCKDGFQHIIGVLQHFITMRLVAKHDHSITPNKDEYVMKATACLGILYRMNEQYKIVDYSEFYNDVVNEQIEIKEDYPHFRSRNGFSFCNYPFILNPTTKGDILKVESMFQMRQELQDSFFRALFVGVNSPYLILEIRREHIIRDALIQLSSKSQQDLKKQLKVQFVGEEGVDEGGVQKEFFQLLVRDMLDPKYGMFILKEESRFFWFNPNPLDDDISLEEFKLIGRLIGLAIYNAVILDLHFPLALYKKLMGKSCDLNDLQVLDPSLGKGLKDLLNFDGDVEVAYGWSFQIEYEVFGQRFKYDLKPSGSNIMLNNDNRQEFVNLYVNFILNTSIERQFNAFKEGFNHVCAGSTIQLFRPEEVELLVCGSSDFDFEALEKVTQYDGGFTKRSKIIKYFWEVVHSFTEEQKKQLLFFTTGSDRVPIGGLSKLQFVIAKNGGDSDRLPTSHTCFNVLLLCEYKTKEKLKHCLLTAINNAEGFGMI